MTKGTEHIHDEWLVLRCKTGDSDALAELIARWQGRLRRLIWRLTDGHADGDDIAQEVWMLVVRKLNRLNDPTAFPHWLYRIAAARCADWVRKTTRDRGLKAQEETKHVISAGQTASNSALDAKNLIRRGLAALPEQQRLILSLFYIEEFSTEEIAEILDIPSGTVKSRLYTARNELRKYLEGRRS